MSLQSTLQEGGRGRERRCSGVETERRNRWRMAPRSTQTRLGGKLLRDLAYESDRRTASICLLLIERKMNLEPVEIHVGELKPFRYIRVWCMHTRIGSFS
eukprot:scaffold286_cov247-Pinguiococcus_pyrenoidosus.AAC.6